MIKYPGYVRKAISEHHKRSLKPELTFRLITPERPFETLDQISTALRETHAKTEDVVQWAKHQDQDPEVLDSLITESGSLSIPQNNANLWPHIHGSVMLGKSNETDHPTVKLDDLCFWEQFSKWAENIDLSEYVPDDTFTIVGGTGAMKKVSVNGPFFRRFLKDLTLGGIPNEISIAIALSIVRKQTSPEGNELLEGFNAVQGARTYYGDIVFEKINAGVIHFQGMATDTKGSILKKNLFRESRDPLRQLTPQIRI